jgi:hypothetical protein
VFGDEQEMIRDYDGTPIDLSQFDDDPAAPALVHVVDPVVFEAEEPQAGIYDRDHMPENVKLRNGDVVFQKPLGLWSGNKVPQIKIVSDQENVAGGIFERGEDPKLIVNAYSLAIYPDAISYYRRLKFLINNLCIETTTNDKDFKEFAKNWPAVPFAVVRVEIRNKVIVDVRKLSRILALDAIHPESRNEFSTGCAYIGVAKLVKLIRNDYYLRRTVFLIPNGKIARPSKEMFSVGPLDNRIQEHCAVTFHTLVSHENALDCFEFAIVQMSDNYFDTFTKLKFPIYDWLAALDGYELDESDIPSSHSIAENAVPLVAISPALFLGLQLNQRGYRRCLRLKETAKPFFAGNAMRRTLTECYCKPRSFDLIKNAWVAYHDEYFGIVFGMIGLELPSYVLLWILDALRSTFKELREIIKLRLIESVQRSCKKVIYLRKLRNTALKKINDR